MTGVFDRITGTSELDDSGATQESSDNEALDSSAPVEGSQRTPQRLRDAAQELLKFGLLEESHKPNLYRLIMTYAPEVEKILEPLDLKLGLDDVRGVVFITVRQDEIVETDDWSHPLVRRQRLNLEQSLMVAILRQHFVAYEQDAGEGASDAHVAVDELIPQLQMYLGDPGSEAKERTRAINLLDQLKGHGLVSAIDAHDRVSIRPIIAHLANPENLQALLDWLREQTDSTAGADH